MIQIADHETTMHRGPSICGEGIRKAFRGGAARTPVLTGIDLEIQPGECVFLAGPSGSGKTTLLSILGCILSPDEGRIEVAGRDVGRLDSHERALLRRDQLGFVFQRFHLIRGLNVLNNVCVPLNLCNVSRRAARGRALELLQAVGLADKVNSLPQNLSAGQCQRVALCRALATNPSIILADEPTASLDAANGQQVMELLRRLTAEQGKTTVVVTHDSRIFHFADRILWLEDGQIVRCEVPANKTDKLPSQNRGPL